MEESDEKAAKQLMSSGNNKAAGFWRRRRPAGRRWSFSTTATPAETVGCSSAHAAGALLSRSCSTTTDAGDGAGEKKQQAPGRGVGARLSRKVKEQRARLYIVRRCVSMLVCWRDTDDN